MFFGRIHCGVFIFGVFWIAHIAGSVLEAQAVGKSEQPLALHPFTVEKSIERTLIISDALYSPDGRKFILLTRKGDLVHNVNIETVLLYEREAVAQYQEGKISHPPAPKILLSRKISHDWGYITNLKWVNDQEIGFTAEGDKGQTQAFVYDLVKGKTTQLTHSPTHVTSFDVSGDRLIYYARSPLKQNQVVRVSDQGLHPLLFAGIDVPVMATRTPVEIFTGSRHGDEKNKVNLPAMGHFDHSLWLSPSGRYAVALVPAVNAPPHWADYKVPMHEIFGFTPEKITADPTSRELVNRMRYWLIDLEKNSSRPLLDAPSGVLAVNRTPVRVFWLKEEKSVIVTNSFLPLKVKNRALRTRRERGPAIAEIDLNSGKVTAIMWEPTRVAGKEGGIGELPERISQIDWDRNHETLTLTIIQRDSGNRVLKSYRRQGTHWDILDKSPDRELPPDHAKPVIEQHQTRNQRPMLYVGAGDDRKLLFDPNPWMKSYCFGKAQNYQWRDDNGVDWQGGLILPPDYQSGKRYPLVVQTHGYDPEEFLIDGPFGGATAFAAQPLANAGIVVLQVEDNNSAITGDERETARVAAGFKAAIDQLVREGVADSQKVGMTAFSRTGIQSAKFIALYPDYLAAYHLADGSAGGWLDRLLFLNAPRSARQQLDYLFVGKPEVWDVAVWAALSPLYQLPKSRPAILLGANGPGSLLGYLELYGLLRAGGHAVEFILYPEGSHVLLKPAERLASQQGSVDWFAFWLTGEEVSDPAKAEQYKRWRQLKMQHEKRPSGRE